MFTRTNPIATDFNIHDYCTCAVFIEKTITFLTFLNCWLGRLLCFFCFFFGETIDFTPFKLIFPQPVLILTA